MAVTGAEEEDQLAEIVTEIFHVYRTPPKHCTQDIHKDRHD